MKTDLSKRPTKEKYQKDSIPLSCAWVRTMRVPSLHCLKFSQKSARCSIYFIAWLQSWLLRIFPNGASAPWLWSPRAATHCDTLQHTATTCSLCLFLCVYHCFCVASTCRFETGAEQLSSARHCNTLQHAATHCNTLQHTATHCNTLQHIATHCNTLQHTATHCNILHSNAHTIHPIRSNTLQHAAAHCNTIRNTILQHNATRCSILQYTATHYNTLQHAALRLMPELAAWHSQHNAAQCSTLQHPAAHCNTL